MPRQARLDAPGTLHHVIIRGIEKRRITDDEVDQENFVSRMGGIAASTGTSIFAWALLTNHCHILLRSSEFGLSRYMRKLLTSYVSFYNRRHRRHGHLFQNRFKSIVCEEEPYFLELVRYIHLNPIRAKIVKTMEELDHYKWAGHGVLLGNVNHEWQNCDYVLNYFARTEKAGISSYRQFICDGVSQGNRPELVGGGLLRSQGGWAEVKALRRMGQNEAGDERILGSSDFVETITNEADSMIRRQFAGENQKRKIQLAVNEVCTAENIEFSHLQSGSRRSAVVRARKKIIQILVTNLGVSLAETARQVGVSTAAVSNAITRLENKKS
jgi:REP element-mobilizing transposase RayT